MTDEIKRLFQDTIEKQKRIRIVEMNEMQELMKPHFLYNTLEAVKDYADILKIRFGDSFKFDVRLDETCRNFKIPKLTIQPLVENSFQHGIRIQEKYGYIQVNVQRENDKIHISVIDNGQGIPDNIIKEMEEGKVPDEKRSLGLRGTVQRLKVIYEDAFSYEIHNEAMSEIHIYINCNVLGEK